MGNLTFSDILTEIYQQCGIDSSNSTNIANATRWANYVQQDICARWPWSWMLGREAIATIPDYSTGTIAISSGATAVTGTTTVFTATHGDGTYYIQFSGANDWYRVASRASNTSITLETAYLGTTNLSAATYVLRKIYYSLSSTADRILDVRNWNTPMKLIQADARAIDQVRPNPQSTNTSYGYMTYGVDASGNIRISPYPFPSDSRLFEIRTHIRPTDGAISIPNKYAHVIAWGGIAVGLAYKRQMQEAVLWNTRFESKIVEMKRQDRQSEDYQPVLQSIDGVVRSRFLQMGDQFPVIGGD